MPTPSNRTPLRVARGTYTNLNASVADIQEGEICYATDQDKLYVKEGGSLVSTQAVVDPDTAVTDVAQTFTAAQRGAISSISVASGDTSKTLDFATANNFELSLANTTTCDIANPSNLTAGQSGSIFLVQDGSGSRLLSWNSYWHWAGDQAPTLTTTANAVDRVDYIVRSATSIHAVATLNVY